MVISLIFSYLETFFLLSYLCFYFILAPDGSARDPNNNMATSTLEGTGNGKTSLYTLHA